MLNIERTTNPAPLHLTEDFPPEWRYLPLKWNAAEGKFRPAIRYRRDPAYGGEAFAGFDRAGDFYIGGDRVTGCPVLAEGVEAHSQRPGCAVGVMVGYCDPALVVVDCDSDWVPVEDGRAALRYQTVYGVDQLAGLVAGQGGSLASVPAARSRSLRHGHLFFRQNPDWLIRSTVIRAGGLALDVKVSGIIVHWSAPGRSWAAGDPGDVPVLPSWLARVLTARRRPYGDVAAGAVPHHHFSSGKSSDDVIRCGVPEGCGHDDTLKSLVWDLAQCGWGDGEIRGAWDQAVEATALKDAGWPFGSGDFERHIRGARDKVGPGLSAAEMNWVSAIGGDV